MGLWGGSGKQNLKNALETSEKVTNESMSSSTTSASATGNATTKITMGDINMSGNSKLDLKAKTSVKSAVKAMKESTNVTHLENEIADKLEQEPKSELQGGLFSPDVNTDNSINTATSIATTASTYSYMAVSAMSTATTDIEIGDVTMTGNADFKLDAGARVKNEIKLKQGEVVDLSGASSMQNKIVQAPSTKTSDMVGDLGQAALQQVGEARKGAMKALGTGLGGLGDVANSAKDMANTVLMVVGVVVVLALVLAFRFFSGTAKQVLPLGQQAYAGAQAAAAGGGPAAAAAAMQRVEKQQAQARGKMMWSAIFYRSLFVYAVMCAFLVILVYSAEIWDSKFNLFKYVFKLFGWGGPSLPETYYWGIAVFYGLCSLALHVMYIKT